MWRHEFEAELEALWRSMEEGRFTGLKQSEARGVSLVEESTLVDRRRSSITVHLFRWGVRNRIP